MTFVRPGRRYPGVWLVPVVVLGAVPDSLGRAGRGDGVLVSLVAGLVVGALWYRWHPKPLAERLLPLAVVAVVYEGLLAVLGAAGGESGPEGPPWYVALGILLSLASYELWFPPRARDREDGPARDSVHGPRRAAHDHDAGAAGRPG